MRDGRLWQGRVEDYRIPLLSWRKNVYRICWQGGKELLSRLARKIMRAIAGDRQRGKNIISSEGDSAQLSSDLENNIAYIVKAFGSSSDLVVRRLRAGKGGSVSAAVIHLDGLVDGLLVAQSVVRSITVMTESLDSPESVLDELHDGLISVTGVDKVVDGYEATLRIAEGSCVVLIDSLPTALACAVQGWEQRSPEEPNTEATVRGSKEGFVESIRVNTSILRRRIAHPCLRIEECRLGRLTRTSVVIAYVQGIARPSIIEEVRSRLAAIDIDSIQESGQLEELIEDAPFSPFPTIARTERPDRIVGALLEGRVAILLDGTPFALIVPVTPTMLLSTPEDYFERFYAGTLIRLIRVLSVFVSLLMPSFYVAVTTYHQEMLPTSLILSIAAQREGVPFPAFLEAFIMEVMFELIREAGIRLPRVIGPAISIVGVLVLGDAAIRAGLVSPIMVMVVAATGIASLATPAFSLAIGIRVLRFAFLFLAAFLGFFGIAIGALALFAYLTSLESFGVPYMSPIAPVIDAGLRDAILRVPWRAMKERPEWLTWYNQTRMDSAANHKDEHSTFREGRRKEQ
jgi:spore germination protein KA